MDREINIVGFKPHKAQRFVIQEMKKRGAAKYNSLACGRQWGKTSLSQGIIFDWSINTLRPVLSWFVTPTYKRSKAVYKEMKAVLMPTGIAKFHDTDLEIRFRNDSKVQFQSAEKYDNLRGPTLDYLVVDEFAFLRREAWEEVLRAMVTVKGKQVLLISTPKGKNLFHELFQRGRSAEFPNYRSFRAPSSSNPHFLKQELEDVRRTLPADIFKQEYEAAFIDGGSVVFRNILECAIAPMKGKRPDPNLQYFAGVDLGKRDDFTVVTIMDHFGNVVYWDRFNLQSWPSLIARIVKALKAYNYPSTYVEANGIGDPVIDAIHKAGSELRSSVKPWITSVGSKAEAVEALILAMDGNEIAFPPQPDLIHELELYTFKYSPVLRKISYSAPVGFHDDGVDSLALANMALRDGIKFTSVPIFSGI